MMWKKTCQEECYECTHVHQNPFGASGEGCVFKKSMQTLVVNDSIVFRIGESLLRCVGFQMGDVLAFEALFCI